MGTKGIMIKLILLFYIGFLSQVVYSSEYKWYSYQQKPANCAEKPKSHFDNNRVSPPSCFVWLNSDGNGWVSSYGPWWIDPNHEMLVDGSGFGLVNVVAFTQIKDNKSDLTDKIITFTTDNRDMNMVQANSLEGLKNSHIYFWFQSSPRTIDNCTPNNSVGENCTRQGDYILTANGDSKFQFDTSLSNLKHTIDLSILSEKDWTCLGSGRNVKYDCMGVAEALKKVYAFGFLAAPVNGCITNIPWQVGGICDLEKNRKYHNYVFNSGIFRFKDFKIN